MRQIGGDETICSSEGRGALAGRWPPPSLQVVQRGLSRPIPVVFPRVESFVLVGFMRADFLVFRSRMSFGERQLQYHRYLTRQRECIFSMWASISSWGTPCRLSTRDTISTADSYSEGTTRVAPASSNSSTSPT